MIVLINESINEWGGWAATQARVACEYCAEWWPRVRW